MLPIATDYDTERKVWIYKADGPLDVAETLMSLELQSAFCLASCSIKSGGDLTAGDQSKINLNRALGEHPEDGSIQLVCYSRVLSRSSAIRRESFNR